MFASQVLTSTTNVTIGGTIVSIGSTAFQNYTGLTNITIPSSVTSIGASSFNGCSSLATISLDYTSASTTINVGLTAFAGVSATLTIRGTSDTSVIPNTSSAPGLFSSLSTASTTLTLARLTTIGDYAFNGSTGITSLTIPSTVTTIGTSSFNGCSNLATINLGYTSTSTTVTVNSSAFSGIKAGITMQGTTTNCVIPNGANSTTGMFISLSTANTAVTLASLTTIGDYAFNGTTTITSLTIPSTVTTIGASAFNGCSNLATINLGYTESTTVSVGSSAFSGIKAVLTIQGTSGTSLIPNGANSTTGMFTSLSTANTAVTLASLTTIGDYAFYSRNAIISITIPSTVTTIGASAFQSCKGLTAITIPSSVVTIGASAFQSCSNVATIYLEYTSTPANFSVGTNAFSSLRGGLTIEGTGSTSVIPNGTSSTTGMFISLSTGYTTVVLASLKTIGDYAFYGCTSIISLAIPHSSIMRPPLFQREIISAPVTTIGANAFNGCSNLATINLGYTSVSTLVNVGLDAFSGLKAGLTIQGTTATSVIPNGIGSATGMFRSLSTDGTTITFVNLTSIGSFAFFGRTTITSITIPSTVTNIGLSAFNGCTGLTSITIPSTVATIGESAFNSCSNLATIYLGYTSTPANFSVGSNAFANVKAGLTIQGTGSTSVIPNGTTALTGMFTSLSTASTTVAIASIVTIGDYAFYGRTTITSITIPSGVANIGTSAFYGCAGLTSITIPSGVINISTNAFNGCTSVASITMLPPNNVATVGTNAFAGCNNFLIDTDTIPPSMFNGVTSLTKVYFTNNVTTISASAFNGCTGLTYINLVNVNNIGNSAFNGCTALKNVVSYPSSLTLGTTPFAPVATTSATIYTNAPNTQNLNLYFTKIVNDPKTSPSLNSIGYYITDDSTSIYNIVSLYGNTYYISNNFQNQLYGIPQSRDSSKLNYNTNLLPGLQYTIYNKSETTQYIQFYPYCNCIDSLQSTAASVSGVFTISNNICTIQPNCVICFIYVGYTDSVTNEGYITAYANNII